MFSLLVFFVGVVVVEEEEEEAGTFLLSLADLLPIMLYGYEGWLVISDCDCDVCVCDGTH